MEMGGELWILDFELVLGDGAGGGDHLGLGRVLSRVCEVEQHADAPHVAGRHTRVRGQHFGCLPVAKAYMW